MKNILINTTLILMSLVIPFNVSALSTTDAKEEIDVNKNSSLTLNYYYDDYSFDNVNVKIYSIASVTSDFQYQLSSNFLSYPIEINGIKTQEEWNLLKDTLNAYIEADNIDETLLYSIENNNITVSDLKPGLYFIKTDTIDTDKYTLLFDSILLNIPDLKEDGSWNYDVVIYPKAEEYTPKYEKIDYTVIKEWRDDSSIRPDSIEIEIYEDGVLIENKTLSSDNNWTYKWTTDDDGSKWTVVERNVADGYKVSILKKDRNFVIINTDPNYEEKNPQTGDNINLYLYLFSGSLIGFVLLCISLFLNKINAK